MKIHILVVIQICFVLASANVFYGDAYQNQRASEKLSQLWEEIRADQTPYGWFSAISLAGIFTYDMSPTLDFYSDEMPYGRKKLIHSVGAVAQAEFVAEKGSPYTGVFQGASNALVRVSTAQEAKPDKEALGNFNPGMAIKILRDWVHSANTVAMLGEGQDTWNTFKYNWSNHISYPKALGLKLVAKKFATATPFILRGGLKTWGKFDQYGKGIDDAAIKIPYKLIFKPSSQVNKRFPDYYDDVFTNQLLTIPIGTTLFDVFAEGEPQAEHVKIGILRTKSQFVTSRFGDKDLFFQHNYFEDDIKMHPKWKDTYDAEPNIELMKEVHNLK